jgi:hypothetical protein
MRLSSINLYMQPGMPFTTESSQTVAISQQRADRALRGPVGEGLSIHLSKMSPAAGWLHG